MPLRLADPAAIESWARQRVRPTALSRRTAGSTEPLIREALADGMADWLLAGGDAPVWSTFLPCLTGLGRGAADLGFGVALMVQNLVTGLHLAGNASAQGARELLAGARRGERIVSFAVTEPDVGAHPAKLTTRAERRDGTWRVSGAKTFSTNAMIADDVVIVAVCGEQNGKRRFVALAVPTSAPGFSRKELTLPVCPTATHAFMEFDVVVSADRQVGEEGEAYLRIVKPFRAYEDLAGAALFLGHLQGMTEDGAHLPNEARGRLMALCAGIEALVSAASADLDAGNERHDAVRLALPYLLEPAVALINENPSEDPLWQARGADLAMVGLGANVRRRFYEKLRNFEF